MGDQFNSTSTNADLVEERAQKGKACIASATALCNEVTMGIYEIETLLMLYNSLFIPVVLYNSQAWCTLTQADITKLKTAQLKYIKRVFHSPSSTPNVITFLETGILPIEYEINKRQLNFLHHIVTQENDDPVKLIYQEQLKIPEEENWANEITACEKSTVYKKLMKR